MDGKKWTKRAGYEVTPRGDKRRGITTTDFNTKPVNPFLESKTETEHSETNPESETEELEEKSQISPTLQEKGIQPTPPFKSVTIHWQECQFKVKFDEISIQEAELTSWLILVHDLKRDPEGPPWSPPVSSQPQNFVIEFEDKKLAVSYFDQQIKWQDCILYLFMIVAPEQ